MYFPDKGCIRPLRHLYGYAAGRLSYWLALLGRLHVASERVLAF